MASDGLSDGLRWPQMASLMASDGLSEGLSDDLSVGLSVGLSEPLCRGVSASQEIGRRGGYKLTIRTVFQKPTVRQLARHVDDQMALKTALQRLDQPDAYAKHGLAIQGRAGEEAPLFQVVHAHERAHEPFPLIGITRAYYVGLHISEFSEKGLNPQIYFEWQWKGRIDISRLQVTSDDL